MGLDQNLLGDPRSNGQATAAVNQAWLFQATLVIEISITIIDPCSNYSVIYILVIK